MANALQSLRRLAGGLGVESWRLLDIQLTDNLSLTKTLIEIDSYYATQSQPIKRLRV